MSTRKYPGFALRVKLHDTVKIITAYKVKSWE